MTIEKYGEPNISGMKKVSDEEREPEQETDTEEEEEKSDS